MDSAQDSDLAHLFENGMEKLSEIKPPSKISNPIWFRQTWSDSSVLLCDLFDSKRNLESEKK